MEQYWEVLLSEITKNPTIENLSGLENLTGLYIDPLIGGGAKDVAPFLILVLIIMIRPYGLFGKEIIERV